MATSSVNKTPFSPPRDEDVDYQAKMLGNARVEVVFLLQTSASLFADGYCEDVSRRISGRRRRPGLHLGDGDRRGDAGARHQADRAGLALFAGGQRQRQALLRGQVRAPGGRAGRLRRDRFLRDRQARPGEWRATPSPASTGRRSRPLSCPAAISRRWPRSRPGKREFKKPVVTTNQAALWAARQRLGSTDPMPGLGRLLA